MSETYLVLPEGPVVCKKCERSGRNAEMQPQPYHAKDDESRSSGENTELKTYRCPACEDVTVFRVM
jgi:hypothetical protein